MDPTTGITAHTVVAAVIHDHDGRVLLGQRPADRHMGGLWEFPGGKVAPGESPAAALRRELAEELGITTEIGEPITFAVHEEPGLRIILLFFAVRILAGEPRALDGQCLAWVTPADLGSYPTPPADAALVRKLMG
jgi:8-oxo-dGTP diphosphatase